MTDKQFSADLLALIARRGLSETRAADLLGVPVFTLRKWAAGQRSPNASAVRLLGVLGMLEALAPALLGALEPAAAAPEPVAHVGEVPVKPKRSRKGSPG
jgi:hypothetical protein